MVFASGLSDVGCKRSSNQDRISIDLQSSVFVVADGLGGEQCGELAAEIAVDAVTAYLRKPSSDLASDNMASAIHLANLRIQEQSQEITGCSGMGSTIVAVSLSGKTATIGAVGDSRFYLHRMNNLWPLTKDDSVVARLVEAGTLSLEEAQVHPMRNVLTQAAGKMDRVIPQIHQVELDHADRLLLTSDGVHGVISHSSLCDILSAGDELETTVHKVIAEGRKLGAPDNLSCVLVEYLSDSR
jgi:PPM family protein phosphatase